jgi:hypothetical protein
MSGTFKERIRTVEAIQWLGDNYADVDRFIDLHHYTYPADGLVVIPELVGGVAEIGDWIVKNKQGAFTIYDDEDFHIIFEEVQG